MNLKDKLRNVGKTALTVYFVIGLSYGTITFPYDNPVTNSKACAAFRTDEVKQKAKSLQSRLFDEMEVATRQEEK